MFTGQPPKKLGSPKKTKSEQSAEAIAFKQSIKEMLQYQESTNFGIESTKNPYKIDSFKLNSGKIKNAVQIADESVLPEDFSIGNKELAAVFAEPITYICQYAAAVNSIPAGYLLSYLAENTSSGEWIALNHSHVEYDICMSRNGFYAARDLLLTSEVLKNKHLSNPKLSVYSINDDILGNILFKKLTETKANGVSQNIIDLANLPLTIPRLHAQTLVWRKQSIKAILYLAVLEELAEKLPFSERKACSNWFEARTEFVYARTLLSRTEQNKVIQYLSKEGIIESKKDGFPAIRKMRISYQRLSTLTAHYLQQT